MPEQRRKLMEQIRQRMGPIDILVNNAGMEFNSYYPELSEECTKEVHSLAVCYCADLAADWGEFRVEICSLRRVLIQDSGLRRLDFGGTRKREGSIG